MLLLDVVLTGRLSLGLILIVAACRKLVPSGRERLNRALANYGLPVRGRATLSLLLPWLELVLGGMLAGGMLITTASACASSMLCVFAVAVAWHTKRGRRFSCGCGRDETIGWQLAARNVLLALVGASVAAYPNSTLALWAGPGKTSATWAPFTATLPVPMIVLLVFAVSPLPKAAWSLVASPSSQTAQLTGAS